MQTFKPKNAAVADDVFMSVNLSIYLYLTLCVCRMDMNSHIVVMPQCQPYTFFFSLSLLFSFYFSLLSNYRSSVHSSPPYSFQPHWCAKQIISVSLDSPTAHMYNKQREKESDSDTKI